MDESVERFLQENHGAVMTTIKRDGYPHVARVAVGLVNGKLWSSGTQTRLRTKHLHRDPRSTLMVLDKTTPYRWLAIESRVTIHDGDDAPQKNLELYRVIAGEPDDVDEYLEAMVKEQRLIYEFSIERTYGQY